MKEQVVTLFKCDFCSKELKRKHAMISHEKNCGRNPNNHKACFNGCKHLVQVEEMIWFDNPGYHPDYNDDEGERRKVKVFKCELLEKLMYPFNIEKRGLPEKYPSTYEDQEPMPKNCDKFEEHEYFF